MAAILFGFPMVSDKMVAILYGLPMVLGKMAAILFKTEHHWIMFGRVTHARRRCKAKALSVYLTHILSYQW